jgi:ADP-ribose pyrophosphatase
MSTPEADPLIEIVTASQTVYRGGYLDLTVHEVRLPDGRISTRELVGHPGAVAIVALDDEDEVLLVRQFRLAAGRVLLEIPAGTLDRHPGTGRIEDPDAAAPRELEEETGYRAATWQRLASFWTAPGFATELMHLYLATGLTRADADRRLADDDEHLELVRMPLADAVGLVETGEIADAKSIAGLLWLARVRGA